MKERGLETTFPLRARVAWEAATFAFHPLAILGSLYPPTQREVAQQTETFKGAKQALRDRRKGIELTPEQRAEVKEALGSIRVMRDQFGFGRSKAKSRSADSTK